MALSVTEADQLELRRLADLYAIAVDRGDKAGLAELFVPDGGVDVHVRGREEPIARLRGAEQLGLVIDGLAVYEDTLHFVGNVAATVDGDEAGAVVYCLAHHLLVENDRTQDEIVAVKYDDRLVRTGAGWRYVLRRIDRRWTDRRELGDQRLAVDRQMADPSGLRLRPRR